MSLRETKPTIAASGYFIPADRNLKIVTISVIFALLLMGLMAPSQDAWCKGGELTVNTTWKPSDGPRLIDGDFKIPAGIVLTIDPGTQVLFEEGANLIIVGGISAVGTFEAPIVFSSASQTPAPGDWGNIRFTTADTTLTYDQDGNYIKGSRLTHCIVEYGGQPGRKTSKEFIGGAVHCRKSSPYLTDLIIRHNKSAQGGGIFCHEFASPYIKDCLFKENESLESGGGVNCFFYSNAVVESCIFQANRAGEHGGGIYFSFSSPQIVGNIIENNVAGVHGGGMYCSNTVTQAISRVRNNVLLSNRAEYNANSIYITAKIETIFQGNCFLAGEGYDVYINALEKDLDLRGNYFGPPSKSDLEARIYDSYDDPSQVSVIYDPVLESPPPDLPNSPQDISFFDLLGDAGYSEDWPLPLCNKAPIYLEVRAQDNNPYHADWIPVRLRSSVSNPKGIVVLAWETGPSTGIFRVQGKVGTATIPKIGQIKAKPGETVFFNVEGVEGFELSRPVHAPKSYLISLKLPAEVDTMHVVSNNPVISWVYRDIFELKQQRYQIQLSEGVPFAAPPYWDSAELIGSIQQATLRGVILEDGSTYGLRLRIFNGASWSDWADLTMHMNSVPTIPEPLLPDNGDIVREVRPEIRLTASTDAENDEIIYELQLYQDPEFTRVLAIEKEAVISGDQVRWAAPIDLADDAEYYWRARARDPYETGTWTEPGQFWVNLVEEPPLPFGLLDPQTGTEVYLLQPVFSWEETFDPDPLSSVRYRVFYSRNSDFTAATTLTIETESTFEKALKLLHNCSTYYWKVEAIDNSGRITVADEIGSFYVNTTPTIPSLTGPFAGEELHPEDVISWNPSTDPNPDDVITYHLQMTKEDFACPILAEAIDVVEVLLDQLGQYAQLEDNIEYRFRVRAEDNHGITSEWSKGTGLFFFNKQNDPPGPVAMPMSPDGGVVINPQPIFSWGAAADVDRSDSPEKLSYNIQFDQNDDFTEGVRQVQVMAGVTRVSVPGLTDNQQWHYRIRARDDDGAVSIWSAVKSFILNTENDPPLPFSLTSPEDGMSTYQLSGIDFNWEAARDPDPLDSLNYLIKIAYASDESRIVSEGKMAGTSWHLSDQLENRTEYVWWVEAEDLAGFRTSSSTKRLLYIDTTPTVPVALPVASGVVTGGETFTWNPSIDPDPNDQVSYDLRIVAVSNPGIAAAVVNDIDGAQVSGGIAASDVGGLAAQTDNLRYAVQVRAKDQHGAVSNWSRTSEFMLDLTNEAPAPPTLLEPSTETTTTTEIIVSWSAAEDSDPSDTPETIKYNLQVVEGTEFAAETVQERAVLSGAHSLTDLQLSDNQVWSLRVRAEDIRGGISGWSEPALLLVNTVEDAPTEPELIVPLKDAVFLTTEPVELSWTTSEDIDYGSSVSYEVVWWSGSDREAQNVGRNTSYTLTELTGDKDYNCKIIATDNTGLTSESSTIPFRVEIPNHPPQKFNLLYPENGKVELSPLFEFSWETAVDNDPDDEIRYTLYLAKDEYFQQDVRTYSDLERTSMTMDEPLEEGSTYFWKVKAQDRKGLTVWGSGSDQNAFRLTVAVLPEEQNQTEEGE